MYYIKSLIMSHKRTYFFLYRCKIPLVCSTNGFPEKNFTSVGVSGTELHVISDVEDSFCGVCSLEFLLFFGKTPFVFSSPFKTFAYVSICIFFGFLCPRRSFRTVGDSNEDAAACESLLKSIIYFQLFHKFRHKENLFFMKI